MTHLKKVTPQQNATGEGSTPAFSERQRSIAANAPVQNRGPLSNEQRAAFFEKYAGRNEKGFECKPYRTSAGTVVTVIRWEEHKDGSEPGYILAFDKKTTKGIITYNISYNSDGSFDSMDALPRWKGGRRDRYDASNKWAVNYSDSFIRDIQRGNKPKMLPGCDDKAL